MNLSPNSARFGSTLQEKLTCSAIRECHGAACRRPPLLILDLLDVIVPEPFSYHARFGIAARFDQPTTDCTVGPGAQTLPCGEEYAQKAPADRSE